MTADAAAQIFSVIAPSLSVNSFLPEAVESLPVFSAQFSGMRKITARDSGPLLLCSDRKVKRHDDWTSLHFHSVAKPQVPADAAPKNSPAQNATGARLSQNATKLLESLCKSVKNRPKKQKTLITHARNFSGKDKPESEAEKVVAELQKAGHLAIDEKGTVNYML